MQRQLSAWNPIEVVGAMAMSAVAYVGGLALLLGSTVRWTPAAMFRRRTGLAALAGQVVRLGTRSLGVVALVQLFVGGILAMQMTPPLAEWQQQGQVAVIIGVGGFRMLGPIITAVVLSGFAGASVAAELGTMVVSEEVEALKAAAVNPIRFLVVPRVLAIVAAMGLLTVVADMAIAGGGYVASRLLLGPVAYEGYWARMRDSLVCGDFVAGLLQGLAFGLLIGLIACHEGLKAKGGPEGVGRAATVTVVLSIVAIVAAACLFTLVFYVHGM